jgi:glycosyltransferase involved in cell wall biosynthesis
LQNKPEISVVMSVHNGGKYIHESVESVLSQNIDFEFIIVNDGSTDESGDILLEYATKDTRIRFIQQKNTGLTGALIRGCAEAQGEFIARMDIGDIAIEGRLYKQAEILNKYQNCVFVSCHTEFFGPKWEYLWIIKAGPVSERPISILPHNPKNGLLGSISCHPSVMFRKTAYETVGGYRKEFYYGQDWDLWYRLSEIGNYFMIPEVLYKCRIFPEGTSMSNAQNQKIIAECSKNAFIARQYNENEKPWIDKAASILPIPNSFKKTSYFPTSFKEAGLYFIGEALRRNNDLRCRKYFFNAIKHSPFRVRSYIRLAQSLSLLNI